MSNDDRRVGTVLWVMRFEPTVPKVIGSLAWLMCVGIILISGCQTGRSGFEPAVVDPASGKVVIYWLTHGQHEDEEPVLATEPYSVVIMWCGDERRFNIYDSQARTMFKTSDFDAFLAKLDSLPEGIEVQRLDSCGRTDTYDMPADARQKLVQVMAKGNRRLVA